MKNTLGCLLMTSVVGFAASAATPDERWIHVRVDDADDAKGRVDIQVPIGLVSTLLPALKGRHGDATFQLEGTNVGLAELRGYWNAVRTSKDGDYVRVRDKDSNVRISKSGGFLRVIVDEEGGGSRVRVKVPLPLVDAVLGGGETIDLDAIGGALAKAPVGELLTVDDENSHVRIWIDAQPAAAREDGP